ncbi:MAG: DUF481 domain-containing protein [Gemmatimonadota bacterium]
MLHLSAPVTPLVFAGALLVPVCPVLSPTGLAAQQDREPGWYDQAEVSLVLTAGNSESSTFGVENRLERLFPRSKLTFDAGGIRVETRTTERSAIGTPDDFVIVEQSASRPTTENYFAALRYDRSLSDRSYTYASGGWVRNRFAGIDDRWTGAAGIGWNVIETDRTSFQADIAGTATSEQPVVGEADSFAGLRLSWDFGHRLTETTKLTSLLVVDENLSDTEDLRAEFDNSAAVDISGTLALKTGVKLLFDNLPALQEVALRPAPGEPSSGAVLVPLDELDTQVTVALIITVD